MVTTYRGMYWISVNYNSVLGHKKKYIKTLFRIPIKGIHVSLFKLQRDGEEKYNKRKLRKMSRFVDFKYEDGKGNEYEWDNNSQYNEIYAFDHSQKYLGTPEKAIPYYEKMRNYTQAHEGY